MASSSTLLSSHFCNPLFVSIRTCLPHLTKINGPNNHLLSRQFMLRHASTSSFQRGALSSTSSSSLVADYSQCILEENSQSNKSLTNDVKFNRVNCLVWILHESARSFSVSVTGLGLDGAGPPLSMAWIGIDVHAWHKHIAYQAAVYALLMAVTEVELFLSHNRSNNPSPVLNILSPQTNFLGDLIETQLNTRNPKLVQWFRTVELPEISGAFMTLFKQWSVEYAGRLVEEKIDKNALYVSYRCSFIPDGGLRHRSSSGVAGTVMAMTCCAAVSKLGSERISCSLFSNSIEDALFELMDATNSLVSLDKLHFLATEAGFEEDFLSYFGSKVLPHKNIEDVEFWICLVQRKLCTAFNRESVTNNMCLLSNNKVEENSLATLALFAYLGRETRLFLSRHGIRVLDKQTRDFVSYLECGILFIYPEFSTLSEYQLLMEVILDEIGWLNFYAAYNNQLRQERRRSKHPPTQAEKEITLHAVFTVCYDVILGYAHCSNSKHQTFGSDLLDFLLKSQALLSTCLEDYWVAYDGTIEMQRIGERNALDLTPSLWMKGAKSSLVVDARYRPAEVNKTEIYISDQASVSSSFQAANTFLNVGHTSKAKPFQRNFIKKYTRDLVAASIDVWMGTQLLFVDISYTMRLVQKKLHGQSVTKREKKKIHRTTSDFFTLIPVAILMLLPVSAVGHAAMFAAIKKYIPNLIPSPYSDERLDLVKQLKRIKKVKVRLIGIEESPSKGVKHPPN